MPTLPTAGNPVSREIPRRNSVDPDDVRRLAAKGLHEAAIARQLGVTASAVSWAGHRHGIVLGPDPRQEDCQFWLANDAEMVRRRQAGEPYSQIATALGVSKNAAIGRANRLGMTHSRTAINAPPRIPITEFPPPGGCLFGLGDLGDADFHWCGARVEIGRSWCPQHLARVYVRVRKPAETA